MKGTVCITTDIHGMEGTIDITILRPRVKRQLVEDMLDEIDLVDDAEYKSSDGLIHVQNWKENIDVEAVRQELVTLIRMRIGDSHEITLG